MTSPQNLKTAAFIAGALACVAGIFSPPIALGTGLLLALFIGSPGSWAQKLTSPLLAYSIIGLGATMNLAVVADTGSHGFIYTAIGISLTFLLGLLLSRTLKVARTLSLLITSGTAICGGSAIAAVGAVIGANVADNSIALACVFILNSVALFLFPALGHWFGLSQEQFGLWAALAIHDTSSVVGAGLAFGPEALKIAATVKLARALWIVPLSLGLGFWQRSGGKRKYPWFILGFIGASALFTLFPALAPVGAFLGMAAKRGFALVLFLIGSQMQKSNLVRVGPRPFFLALALWILVSTCTLLAILSGWIS